MHPGDELIEAERLGHIIVGTHRQAAHLGLGRVARRQEEDRHAQLIGGEPPLDLETVEVGQHHVKHDQVRPKRRRRRQRAAAALRDLDLEALIAHRRRDELGNALLVIDDEEARPWLAVAHSLGCVAPRHWATTGRLSFSRCRHAPSKAPHAGRTLKLA
jgi:hypothetical protein